MVSKICSILNSEDIKDVDDLQDKSNKKDIIMNLKELIQSIK